MTVQNHCKHFTQISQGERVKIFGYLQQGKNKYEISKLLGRHHTTIGREIENNSIDHGWGRIEYDPLHAQKNHDKKRKKALEGHVKLKKNHKLRSKIYSLLSREDLCRWPDEILGRLKLEWRTVVSTTTLYNYIRKYTDWWKYLRHKQDWYKNARWKRGKTERIKGVKKIEKRCKIANDRKRIWDKELDTIISKNHQWGLCSAVDRKSRYLILKKIPNLKKDTLLTVLTSAFKKEWVIVKTLTSDNWPEFSALARLCRRTKSKGYTCHSYCSREKGTNEKHNGFVRRFIPKGADISERTDSEIQEIQNKLNHKPRKILWYKTPYEVEFNTQQKYT